jgi:hypothetical protein
LQTSAANCRVFRIPFHANPFQWNYTTVTLELRMSYVCTPVYYCLSWLSSVVALPSFSEPVIQKDLETGHDSFRILCLHISLSLPSSHSMFHKLWGLNSVIRNLRTNHTGTSTCRCVAKRKSCQIVILSLFNMESDFQISILGMSTDWGRLRTNCW